MLWTPLQAPAVWHKQAPLCAPGLQDGDVCKLMLHMLRKLCRMLLRQYTDGLLPMPGSFLAVDHLAVSPLPDQATRPGVGTQSQEKPV